MIAPLPTACILISRPSLNSVETTRMRTSAGLTLPMAASTAGRILSVTWLACEPAPWQSARPTKTGRNGIENRSRRNITPSLPESGSGASVEFDPRAMSIRASTDSARSSPTESCYEYRDSREVGRGDGGFESPALRGIHDETHPRGRPASAREARHRPAAAGANQSRIGQTFGHQFPRLRQPPPGRLEPVAGY